MMHRTKACPTQVTPTIEEWGKVLGTEHANYFLSAPFSESPSKRKLTTHTSQHTVGEKPLFINHSVEDTKEHAKPKS